MNLFSDSDSQNLFFKKFDLGHTEFHETKFNLHFPRDSS